MELIVGIVIGALAVFALIHFYPAAALADATKLAAAAQKAAQKAAEAVKKV